MSKYPGAVEQPDGSGRVEGFLDFTDPTNTPAFLRGPFPFTFATAGLTAGVAIYTPNVGDVIYDIGVEIATAFDGTTPLADVGTFSGGNNGLFDELAGTTVDLTAADAAVTDNAGLSHATNQSWLQAAIGSVGAAAGSAYLPGALYVTVANPILLVISQTGAKGGAATGATVGVGAVYVLTSQPVRFS
jgi:hypothetical protein